MSANNPDPVALVKSYNGTLVYTPFAMLAPVAVIAKDKATSSV